MTKVNLDKLQATDNGNIETIIATVDLPNGVLIALDEAVEGNREAIKAVAPVLDQEMLLVAAVERQNNPFEYVLDALDYTSPKDKETRAYHLTIGDKFQVEQSLFDVAPVAKDVVTGNPATMGYTKTGADTAKTTFVVERLTKFDFDARPMALLRVLTV